MNFFELNPQVRTRTHAAFSLLELMLSISIMTVIVLALYGTFYYTQRALRSNVTQVDVMESGRATMDILTRELAQAAACGFDQGINFQVGLSPVYKPVRQPLLGDKAFRTNVLQEVFFVTKYNREFVGTFYRVLYAENGVGTLSKFSTNIPAAALNFTNLIRTALLQPATNFMRIADGVIHFRIKAYDPDGYQLAYYLTNGFGHYRMYRVDASGGILENDPFPNLMQRGESAGPNWYPETRYAFLGAALPGSLDLELAIIEPQALVQFKSFPAGSAAAVNFLSNRVGQVHLFRQKVPVRNNG
jgi:hypothetical protein